ncbi:putative ychA-1 [Escherichia coli 2-052-05_S4_C2]|nr:putative ychA-1 [Escherichia coli 2-052-05_S4_C2]
MRTRQSPPNPLARFRAVATVRCVKNRACSDRSGRAASVAP